MHKMLDFGANFKNTYGIYFSGEYSDISIYSPQSWSVYERVKNDLMKLNNVLEGWNRSLNSCIFQPKPSIYEIGMVLKQQHAIGENKNSKIMIDIVNGQCVTNKSKKNIEKNILLNYDNYTGIDYLKIIGLTMKVKEFLSN
ncbi:hypothetical protein DMUE_5808 [Dictyocoela muelleri]|nr:hypothetical protein DMUE_5808 [Dictyocoela muelleri]